jgi:hypothetical protein
MLAPLVVLAALAAACGPRVILTDDVDLTWDFALTLHRFEDKLHTPYVRGAPVSIYVDADDDDLRMRGWRVVTSDPAVFSIEGSFASDDAASLAAPGRAVGEGSARLDVLDAGGARVGSGTAEVLVPDQAALQAHGYLIIGREAEAQVTELRILEGGEATFLVRYSRGGQELHGNGVLSVDAPADLTATARTSFLFENREWLTVSGSAAGRSSITVYADGAAVSTIDVETVSESDIDRVDILTQDEGRAEPKDSLVALAQAYDAAGQRIFGVDFDWDVDGVQEAGEGDLYRYTYAPGRASLLTASRGGKAGSRTIHSSGGYVSSSNAIGCAVGPRAGGTLSGAALAALLGALLVAGARRRV